MRDSPFRPKDRLFWTLSLPIWTGVIPVYLAHRGPNAAKVLILYLLTSALVWSACLIFLRLTFWSLTLVPEASIHHRSARPALYFLYATAFWVFIPMLAKLPVATVLSSLNFLIHGHHLAFHLLGSYGVILLASWFVAGCFAIPLAFFGLRLLWGLIGALSGDPPSSCLQKRP